MWCAKCMKTARLCPVSFGFAWGIVIGLFMMLFAWATWLSGYGTEVINQYAMFYSGYNASFVGGLIGGIWGLVEGFIFGFFIALFYNLCARCCGSRMCCKKEDGTCNCDNK